ncbi:hypothetical protein ACFU99_03245 [Streptomyces sp. NPDC057654]
MPVLPEALRSTGLHAHPPGPDVALPGLTQVEGTPVTRTLKRAGLVVGG